MKTKMNPSNDGFSIAQNELSLWFVSNGIHTKVDAKNLQGNKYEKDPSASKDKTQRGKKVNKDH